MNVEDRIVSVEEIFRLQDADEYSAAERLYLSAARSSRSAVVLAASRGRGSRRVTVDRPKVMLPIAGKPLLRWLVDGFKKESINEITVVGGYRADAIETAGIRLVRERALCSRPASSPRSPVPSTELESDTVISYGDLLFRSYVLRDLVESKARFLGGRGFLADRRRQPHGTRFRLLLARATTAGSSARRCGSSA